MQKIRKTLKAVSEKTELPTNQLPTTPILQDLADAGPKCSWDQRLPKKLALYKIELVVHP